MFGRSKPIKFFIMARKGENFFAVTILTALVGFALVFIFKIFVLVRGSDALYFIEIHFDHPAHEDGGNLQWNYETAYGSIGSFEANGLGKWGLSMQNDSGRRAIKRIWVEHNDMRSLGFGSDQKFRMLLKAEGEVIEDRLVGARKGAIVEYTPASYRPRGSLLDRFDGCLTYRGDVAVFASAISAGFWVFAKFLYLSLMAVFAWAASYRVVGSGFPPTRVAGRTDSGFLPPKESRRPSIAEVAAIVSTFLGFALLGHLGWPALHWDAAAFAPPILNAARSGEFLQAAYPFWLNRLMDPTFSHHGFAAIFIHGLLAKCSSWDKLLGSYGLWNAASAVLWWFVFRRGGAGEHGRQWLSPCFGILAGVAAGCLSVGLQGRPEHPAVLIAGIPFLVRPWLPRIPLCILLGSTAGVLLACSPSCGVLAGCGIVVWSGLISDYRFRTFARMCTLGGSVALGIFVLFLFLTPLHPFDWFQSFFRASGHTLDFSDHLFRVRHGGLWGTSMIVPFWSVLIVFYSLLIAAILVRLKRIVPLILFVAACIKFQPVFTDYGYACAMLPLVWLGRRWFRLPVSQASPVMLRVIRGIQLGHVIWLAGFLLVFLQFLTEAAVFNRLGYSFCRDSKVISLCDFEAVEVAGWTPVIGYAMNTPQSYVTLGSAGMDFVAVDVDAETRAWGPEEKRFFSERSLVPALLVLPFSGETPATTKTIGGCVYELADMNRTHGWGVSLFRKRPVGYPFAVYRLVSFSGLS